MKKLMKTAMIVLAILALMIPVFASAGSVSGTVSASNAGYGSISNAMYGYDMWVNCANGKRLNLREQPSTGSRRITLLDNGTHLQVLDLYPNGWVEVRTDNGTYGYVQKQFLVDRKPGKYEITEREDNFVTVNPYTVVAKALNARTSESVGLRVKPNKTSQAIRRLYEGDELEVLAVGRTWSKVYDPATGKTGYVANDYIQRF